MTAVYGVLGWPVAHSRSPAMHNAAFAAIGLDALYVPFAVPPERLPAAVAALRALGIAGANATLPHKAALLDLLDEIEPGARAIGAVNTIVRDGQRLLGTNTDAEGLARSLQHAGVVLAGTHVLVLGTGGAARAAVVGLSGAGAERVVVAGRRPEQAEQLIAELRLHCSPATLAACDLTALPGDVLARSHLLVQATSATLGESPGARAFADSIPIAGLPPEAVVCDLVYKPLRTALLQRAQQRGLRTVDGLGMLLHQGALAFERWTGHPAPLDAMRNAL